MFFKWAEQYNLAALVFSLFDILTIFYLPNILLKKSVLDDPVLVLSFAATLNVIFAILKYRRLLRYCSILCIILSIGFLHGLAIILGAPLKLHWEKTLAWAFWHASVAFVPLLIHLGHSGGEWSKCCNCFDLSNPTDTILKLQCVGSLLFSWCSSFIIVMDWKKDWQKWPIPNIVGALIGHFLFGLIGILYYFLQPVNVPRIKRGTISREKKARSPTKELQKSPTLDSVDIVRIKNAPRRKASASPVKRVIKAKSKATGKAAKAETEKQNVKDATKPTNGRRTRRGSASSASSVDTDKSTITTTVSKSPNGRRTRKASKSPAGRKKASKSPIGRKTRKASKSPIGGKRGRPFGSKNK